MITPLLERLILKGLAEYRNISLGMSDTWRIPVENNKTVIIVDIQPQNCYLKSKRESEVYISSGNVTQLTVMGEKRMNHYVWRQNYNIFHTYLVHVSDIQVRIAILPDWTNFAVTVGNPPAQVNEPPFMLGYQDVGFGINQIVTQVNCAQFGNYNPLSNKLYKSGTAEKDNFVSNYNDFTQPDITASMVANGNDGYPIINMGLVVLEKGFDTELH
jgi:hypothetical protein